MARQPPEQPRTVPKAGGDGSSRPGLTRGQIATAAIRIADTDGLAALSMRRLAAGLGAGTMSLYYHVPDKEDLVALICDEAMGEAILPPDEITRPWPDGMLAIAHITRTVLHRHPWLTEATGRRAGPNTTRHFDQTLQVVMALDVPLAEQIGLAATVDDYVYGYCAFERIQDPAALTDEATASLDALIETGSYPALATLRDRYGPGTFSRIQDARDDPARFERDLRILLDRYAGRWRGRTA